MEIICTVGPSCNNIETLREMKVEGMTIVRVNLKHHTWDEAGEIADWSKELELPLIVDIPDNAMATEAVAVAKRSEHPDSRVALAFVHSAKEVMDVREITGDMIVSKLEDEGCVQDINNILDVSKEVMIDRKDMMTMIGANHLGYAQYFLVGVAVENECPLYIASGVLTSLVNGTVLSSGDVLDVFSTSILGVSGFVLAEETAIAVDPVLSVRTLVGILGEADQAYNQVSTHFGFKTRQNG